MGSLRQASVITRSVSSHGRGAQHQYRTGPFSAGPLCRCALSLLVGAAFALMAPKRQAAMDGWMDNVDLQSTRKVYGYVWCALLAWGGCAGGGCFALMRWVKGELVCGNAVSVQCAEAWIHQWDSLRMYVVHLSNACG